MPNINDIIKTNTKAYETLLNRKARVYNNVTYEQFVKALLPCVYSVMLERNDGVSDFVIDADNTPIIQLMWKHLTKADPGTINSISGIILNGRYGCGKSVLISGYCRLYSQWYDNPIREIHSIELSEHIRTNGVLPYCHEPMCIQDLGKEPDQINNFGNKYNPISNLLAIRAEVGALTFGSTNMSRKSFGEFYGEYIEKRIVEHVNLIFLPGKSRRPDYSINQPK